jgi:hypothetical protein
MDQQRNVEATSSRETRLTYRECTFRGCWQDDRLADTRCSTPGCLKWCHYEPCYTRFCDASEFYPGLDTNPSREGLLITFCQTCAYIHREDYRNLQHQNAPRNTWSDSNTTQEYRISDSDSNTTQEYELSDENRNDPVG